MARYPGATWHRCPGSEPSIRPTQVIYHTAVMRDLVALRNFFCSGRSGGIESHFGVGGKWGDDPAQDGRAEQWRDTDEQADANRAANRRPDGTGAISIETCDNAPQRPDQIEPWTPKQVAKLVDIGLWAHDVHNIPLRICRSPDDPGYGWHGMWDNTRFEFSDGSTPWTPSAGKVCPGGRRIAQLKTIVFPAIFAGRHLEDDDMTVDELDKYLRSAKGQEALRPVVADEVGKAYAALARGEVDGKIDKDSQHYKDSNRGTSDHLGDTYAALARGEIDGDIDTDSQHFKDSHRGLALTLDTLASDVAAAVVEQLSEP